MSDDVTLLQTHHAITETLKALSAIEREISDFRNGAGHQSPGYFALIGQTLLGGTVDIFYRGHNVSVPLVELGSWLRNPSVIGAKSFLVDEEAFSRWVNLSEPTGTGSVAVQCNHRGCKLAKSIAFADPREMNHAEACQVEEVWYCHHHRQHAWDMEQAIGDHSLSILRRLRVSPGCTRQQLGAAKQETDFLASIGLMCWDARDPRGRRGKYAFYLTSVGEVYITQYESRTATT